MSKPLIQSAAVATLCLLVAASPALAKKKIHHHRSYATQSYDGYGSTNPYPSYTTSAATQSLIGRYTSQDFYPNPLVLNITGMDAAGNLQGTMSGMLSKPQNGEDPAYERWQRVFGRDAQAVFRNGRIDIRFNNGANYTLNVSGNQLDGQFTAEGENRHLNFMKSQIRPTAWGY